MTNDYDRCTWSDLPRHMCSHCGAVHQPTNTERVEAVTTLLAERARRVRVTHSVVHQAPAATATARHLQATPAELVDYVTALCDPTHHGEAYLSAQTNPDGSTTFVTQRHRTTSPPLLVQLWATVEASGSAESGQRSFASKPSARLEAIDAANDVERQVFRWLTKLGHRPDHQDDTIAAVRALGALAVGVDRDTHRAIESDVRSWWIRARVLTGWDSPAWRPNNTCPLCGVKGGLRIRLDHHTGTCVECHCTWEPATIGLLADHIRIENHEDDVADTAAG